MIKIYNKSGKPQSILGGKYIVPELNNIVIDATQEDKKKLLPLVKEGLISVSEFTVATPKQIPEEQKAQAAVIEELIVPEEEKQEPEKVEVDVSDVQEGSPEPSKAESKEAPKRRGGRPRKTQDNQESAE